MVGVVLSLTMEVCDTVSNLLNDEVSRQERLIEGYMNERESKVAWMRTLGEKILHPRTQRSWGDMELVAEQIVDVAVAIGVAQQGLESSQRFLVSLRAIRMELT